MLSLAFEYFVLVILSMVFGATCSLDPSLNAYSASANQAHPNHGQLTKFGKGVEKEIEQSLQPRPNEITYTAREVPRLRFVKLKTKAENAEFLRNHWHKEKNRLDTTLPQRSSLRKNTKVGKILAKFPDTMEGKHKYARQKRDSHKKVLSDISKDSAVHKRLGHINSDDEREINKIKFRDSIQLGYTSAGSPRSPNVDHNAV
ncbi:uncharacterized protein FA14DRAFT_153523 [Meira miltonrushii]|uniref:Uncharacterized protein n=1 Tax=Meira miltonrushii TaxID=1280837 RepID=A0A316VRS3_9BASI|nr:uncharacterized protein FA14DRAFT_153523 [Meira miltonrushii]PWN38195.1 hypothetical protein FA14DRAFT_153523 [Meira miltonrushii]